MSRRPAKQIHSLPIRVRRQVRLRKNFARANPIGLAGKGRRRKMRSCKQSGGSHFFSKLRGEDTAPYPSSECRAHNPRRAARADNAPPRSKNTRAIIACLFLSAMPGTHAQSYRLDWVRLPSVPDPIGFAGPFAGTSHGALIVAGGANFPAAMPWEGGQKAWYESIFVLPKPQGRWLTGFKLPHAMAYGISVSAPEGVLCAGGSDAHQHFRDV